MIHVPLLFVRNDTQSAELKAQSFWIVILHLLHNTVCIRLVIFLR